MINRGRIHGIATMAQRCTVLALAAIALSVQGQGTFPVACGNDTVYFAVVDARQHLAAVSVPYSNMHHSWNGLRKPSGHLTIPTVVTHPATGAQYTVTAIGANAFQDCDGLRQIELPESVHKIGRSAFQLCQRLEHIDLPDGLVEIGDYTFLGCTSLRRVTLGDSLTNIGRGAFEDCESLEAVELPNNLKRIGNSAFQRCTTITSITIPTKVEYIGISAFKECLRLESVRYNAENCRYAGSIASPVFDRCTMLRTLTIGDSVTYIPRNAFNNCRELAEVTIPRGIDEIDDYAFHFCSSLRTVRFNAANCTWVSPLAFESCLAFECIDIGEAVRSLPDAALYLCPNLTTCIYRSDSCVECFHYDRRNTFLTGSMISRAQVENTTGEWPKELFDGCWCLDNAAFADAVRKSHSQMAKGDINISDSDDTGDTNWYVLRLTTNDPSRGVVSGGGRYRAGTNVTLNAKASTGFRFIGWADGVDENPRVYQITQDQTLTAYFIANMEDSELNSGDKSDSSTIDINSAVTADPDDMTVLSMEGRIYIRDAAGSSLYIYDDTGRLLISDRISANIKSYRMPSAGVYLVVLDNAAPVKVIVRQE